jgi:hypothetical protein
VTWEPVHLVLAAWAVPAVGRKNCKTLIMHYVPKISTEFQINFYLEFILLLIDTLIPSFLSN